MWMMVLIGLTCGPSAAPSTRTELTQDQQETLARALQPLHDQYDAAERMLKRPFSSPGYHTTLKGGQVHPTRDSLRYAAALLDTNQAEHRQRAIDILRRTLALQDQDPESKTYGIWSWFLEEPLGQMSSPDWNWADFCGRELLQVKLYHGHELPEDLMQRVDASIRHAARSIQRRNVGPGYTNIAILGTYVTLVTAETYGDVELKRYAMDRVRRLHAYTQEQGAFTEYNSPTYTMVSLKGLAQLRAEARDPDARRMADELCRIAWEEVATHFHAPTRQWAGPHSRCYSTLLKEDVLSFIQRATDARVDFGIRDSSADLESYRVPVDCPRELEPLFIRLDAPRTVVTTFGKGEPPVVGTTYLHPKFTIGSVSRADLWNQRRPLIAYWGPADEPSYLVVRMLKDGYDFAAAQIFTVQKEGRILAAINFGTDGGNTHVSLDRLKNGVFRAKDLRLRLELGGAARSLTPRLAESSGGMEIRSDGVMLRLQVPFARIGTLLATPKPQEGGADYVFHSGDEREVRLSELEVAAIGLALEIGTELPEDRTLTTRIDAGQLTIGQQAGKLSVPVKPDRVGILQRAVRTAP